MAIKKAIYKSVWYWDDDTFLTCSAPTDGEKKSIKLQTRNLLTQPSEVIGKNIQFVENVDQQEQKTFKQRFQRQVKPNVPNVVTMQDIKDVVTFLSIGSIPESILTLIHSNKINSLFRILIVYFQLYLQIWDDLKYRRCAYSEKRLKHPISVERETLCRTRLSQLRSLAGQEYALLVTGEGFYKRFHHMNNPLNRSYTTKDVIVYEYLIRFTARVVWVALNRSNYKEIEVEVARLFDLRNVRGQSQRKSVESILTDSDRHVLHGEKICLKSHWEKTTPLVADIFINDGNHELLLMNKEHKKNNSLGDSLTGMKALLVLPEELLVKFNLTLGILGQPRDGFEVMLHVKQGPQLSLTEELEKQLANLDVEVEKPVVKMYQYLKELETVINLKESTPTSDEAPVVDLTEEIKLYVSTHQEDSIRALKLWKETKGERNL